MKWSSKLKMMMTMDMKLEDEFSEFSNPDLMGGNKRV